MLEINERIKSLLNKEEGKTQAALARACGVSTSAVTQWMNGSKGIDWKHLRTIAAFLGTSEEWLLTGKGDVRSYVPNEDRPPEGVVAIPEYGLTFVASNADGSQIDPDWVVEEGSTPRWYSASFFHSLGVSPGRCRRARVTGDSMEPSLLSGDSVLWVSEVDPRPGCVHIHDGEIYVLSIDGNPKVKRLARVKGGIEVISDNPRYRPEVYIGDECNAIRIYGRVVEISRKL